LPKAFNRVTNFIVVPLLKIVMSQAQYLKMLEKEIQRINKRIDLKILQGEAYFKEARDHKLLLQKVRFHSRKPFLGISFSGYSFFEALKTMKLARRRSPNPLKRYA